MSRFALVIGNSEYQDPKLARLVTPAEDVNDLAEVLQAAEIGGFDQVQCLVNRPMVEVRRAIARFFADKRPDDLLVLYFSGHGVRDDRGLLYLAVQDTEYALLNATSIPAAFVSDEMDRSRSRRQVLILDCCHSGAFAQGAKGVSGESVGTGIAFAGTGFGRAVLTATDATQFAWEGDRLIGQAENSVFTRFLVEGLRSGAADSDADGRITLDELYDYVYEQVVQATSKQTPRKFVYNQQGDVVIAKNPRPARKPAELAPELRVAIASPYAGLREGAVRELERLALGDHPGLAQAALAALQELAGDDSQRVSQAARAVLTAYARAQPSPVPPEPPVAGAEHPAHAPVEPALEPHSTNQPVEPAPEQLKAGPPAHEPVDKDSVRVKQSTGQPVVPAHPAIEAHPAQRPAPPAGPALAAPQSVRPGTLRARRGMSLWLVVGVTGLACLLLAAALALLLGPRALAPRLPTSTVASEAPPAETLAPTAEATTEATAAPSEGPTASPSEPVPDQPQLPAEFASVVPNYVTNVSAVRTIPLATSDNTDWWFYQSSRPSLSDGRLSIPGSDDWYSAIVRRPPLHDNMGVLMVFSSSGTNRNPGWCEIGVSAEFDQETAYILMCDETLRVVAAKFGVNILEDVVPLTAIPAEGFQGAFDQEYGLLIARGPNHRVEMVIWRLQAPAEQATYSIEGHAYEPNYVFAKPYPGTVLTIRDYVEIEFEGLR